MAGVVPLCVIASTITPIFVLQRGRFHLAARSRKRVQRPRSAVVAVPVIKRRCWKNAASTSIFVDFCGYRSPACWGMMPSQTDFGFVNDDTDVGANSNSRLKLGRMAGWRLPGLSSHPIPLANMIDAAHRGSFEPK